ncbi:GMC family oxidoreductase N-terminal domain-containing protein [Mucilaginibacter pocheonensis]|uniref:Choline dehydrogenase-like flavoprotein n=1 Tax=Mucilaginibacter pocheonensis TaxID=398050 RepID=A0ABU1TD80_9SPHI|nr:GMC family oxidoreductase N-terminal domain-containing protein [Mucilaginibacter pocheonensis]MDR6943145.1 choline dehydrogenase-like flavoprotein [Mucilaginibacter pocheonensis]
MNRELVQAEKYLKSFLKLLLVLSVITLFFHFFPKLTPAFLRTAAGNTYATISGNSVLQVFLIILLLALAIGDVRRFSPLIRLFKWVLALAIIWTAMQWIRGREATAGTTHLWQLITYTVVFVVLWILFRAAGIARYNLKYLSIQQFQTLQALAEVCISGDTDRFKLQIEPVKVAINVDTYLIKFKAQSKWVMKMVLTAMEVYPLLSLNPLLSLMQPAARLAFLKKRFITDLEFQNTPRWYGELVQAAIRMSKQLCFMGYYSDPAVYESIGYVPFSKRKDIDDRKRQFPGTHSQAALLKVLEETDIKTSEITADVVIVGSGAAASILANQLVQAGRKVLLVEFGGLEQTLTFSEDEVDMVSRLYADGALQLSRDFRFQVFQGRCVGGSTVVNNAVCFETPAHILDKWTNEMGIDIDRERYASSMEAVYKLMKISHTPTMTDDRFLNPGGRLFADACKKMGYDKPELDSVMANINGCLGSGYCNIGCMYGKKLSMLDTILPQTQLANPDALQIIANCEAISFNRNGSKIVSLTGKFKNGRQITIKGNTFVSSAGAVSSSILLMKSKLGIANAGKKLAFNFGTQITAAFTQPVNSYDGLQISHFLKTNDRRYVMETWFNPPMFQSTAMPGWFDQHFYNMQQYSHMACTGILVGTASNAEVKIAGLFGRDINYVPTEDDFDSLMDGLEKAAEIYLNGGAERVMPNTFNYYEYKTVKELKENLRKNVKASPDISTGSGHPQGGNVMSNDPKTGVVDAGFKVFGFDNLFVCDASVFPTSLGVNPQVTVMTLAHYAAPIIARN